MNATDIRYTLRTQLTAVRRWPIWGVPRGLRAYVLAVQMAAVGAIGVAAARTTFRATDLGLFLVLLSCAVIAIEATRRVEEPQGTRARDLYSIWCLPIAVLLPPVWALVAPIPLLLLTQWRVRRGLVYRRVFSGAAIGLSFGAASVVAHAVPGSPISQGLPPYVGAAVWPLVVVACGVVRWFVNIGLVVFAVRASDPETTLWELLSNRESVYSDLVEVSLGVLVTVVVAVHPALVLVALPSVLLQQRFLLHGQLVTQARIDSKTGLLNAHTWEREAVTEISRAQRTQTPLAVLLIDIDHFKSVNDRYGHLAGDRVLRAVADTLETELRDYDIVGRIGGEEFAVLLPATDAEQAGESAERLRRRIADVAVTLEGDQQLAHVHIRVTVSIGVTTTTSDRHALADVLATADLALYRAKGDGRDRVQVLAEDPSG